MNQVIHFLGKLKGNEILAWAVALLIVIAGYKWLRAGLGFLLEKCYEILVQHRHS